VVAKCASCHQRRECQGYAVDPTVLWRDDEIDSEPDREYHRQRIPNDAKSSLSVLTAASICNETDAKSAAKRQSVNIFSEGREAAPCGAAGQGAVPLRSYPLPR
jgi:hypothetical protein